MRITNHDQTTEGKAYKQLTATQKRAAVSITHFHGKKINPKFSTFRTMRGGISGVVDPFFIEAPVAKSVETIGAPVAGEIDMLALLMGA